MTHRDEGHYAKKHGDRAELHRAIADAVRKSSTEGKVPCAEAFRIAKEMDIEPSEVGRTLDLLEMKIIKCQLGLFGHEKAKRLIVKPAEIVPQDLEDAIRAGLVNGQLPCAIAWGIAKRFGVPKMSITSACERLSLHISRCQLGAF
jgi:hypothetical protein